MLKQFTALLIALLTVSDAWAGGSQPTIITSPNSTISVGGTTPNPTIDINLANPNIFTAPQSGTPGSIANSSGTFTPSGTSQSYYFTFVHASCPCTLANPTTTLAVGTMGVFIITQSPTGSDLITTYGSNYQAAGGTANITLSTAASAVDVIPYSVLPGGIIYLGGVGRGISH